MPELRSGVRPRRRPCGSSPVVAPPAAEEKKKPSAKRKAEEVFVGSYIKTRAAKAKAAEAALKGAQVVVKEKKVEKAKPKANRKKEVKEKGKEAEVVVVVEGKVQKMGDKSGALSAKGSAGLEDDASLANFPDKV